LAIALVSFVLSVEKSSGWLAFTFRNMFNEHVRRAVVRREATGVSFGFYNADEIRRLSVMEV
jgi:hypothetical protein